jgi:hypothetical protein
MKVRNVRLLASMLAALTILAITALAAPIALGATNYELRFVRQPLDAKVDALITSSRLNDATTSFVQVEVVEAGTDNRVTTVNGPVGFTLRTGTGFAAGTLNVVPQPLVDGVATFGLTANGNPTLSIGTENEPQFTDYALVPRTTKGPRITGSPSSGFDVWEDGEACTGLDADFCEANLRGGNDHYTFNAAGTLGASELTSVLPGLVCPGQKAIFSNSVFSYATTGSNTPVFLENHITKADWRASANNGQAHADWCIGLPTAAPWINNGANYSQLDTDGIGGPDLYVAVAPKCPVANPQNSAPCIVSQNSDGKGGSLTVGWLPFGDPPRRT